MKERRQYFRISAFARVGLRKLDASEVDGVRRRIRARHVPAALSPGAIEDAAMPAERRLELDLLRRIALMLERIDGRLDRLADADAAMPVEAAEIALSGSGFAGPFGCDVSPDDQVEVELDLWDSGLPRVVALARAVAPPDESRPGLKAFRFEELHPEDEERIVRLALKSQSQWLRDGRTGEAS